MSQMSHMSRMSRMSHMSHMTHDGSVFGKRDLLAIFHVMKTNLIAEKIPFQMLQTI